MPDRLGSIVYQVGAIGDVSSKIATMGFAENTDVLNLISYRDHCIREYPDGVLEDVPIEHTRYSVVKVDSSEVQNCYIRGCPTR